MVHSMTKNAEESKSEVSLVTKYTVRLYRRICMDVVNGGIITGSVNDHL